MNPGHYFVRSFLPKDETIQSYPDTLTIYDRGDKQGFLIERTKPTRNTTWVVFQVDYRLVQDDGTIVEGGELLSESEAPFQYFSIESYPLRLEPLPKSGFLFSLPQAQILLTQSDQPLPLRPQQPLPSPLQSPIGAGPESRESPRLGSSRPTGGQHLSQNKNTASPKSKALSSSNPKNHEQPSTQAPGKQAQRQQRPLPKHRNDRESSESLPWKSLAQQSPYSRPPPEVAKEFAGQASTSPSPKDFAVH